jgi:WbqC-like protein family
MNCVILQPSYLPWRGYFDLIRRADVFVFYDDVQYDKHGWRNRNRFKTAGGTKWLTIPVHSAGNVETGLPIHEVRTGGGWARKHLATIQQSYRKAPHYAEVAPLVEELLADPPELLAELTIASTQRLAAELGIDRTRFVRSSQLGITGTRVDRLLAILQHLGATHYISGPSARSYIDAAAFERAGIGLEYIVYDYPEYEQLHPPYDPQVSVLDLMFMKGRDAGQYIWGANVGANVGDRP